jgi:hypothetical protein
MRRLSLLPLALLLVPAAASGTPGPSILVRVDNQPQGMAQSATAPSVVAITDYKTSDAGFYAKVGPTAAKFSAILLKQQPAAVTPVTARWMNEMLSGNTPQHAVEVLFLDASSKPLLTMTEPGAYLARIDLPKVPAQAGEAPPAITLHVLAQTQNHGGAESAVPAGVTASVPDVSVARVSFDGIGALGGNTQVAAWTPSARSKDTERVDLRTLETLAGGTGSFTVTFATTASSTSALHDWSTSAQKKNGKIEYVAAGGRVVFTVQLGGVSVVKLTGPQLGARSSTISMTQVDFAASSVLVAAGAP